MDRFVLFVCLLLLVLLLFFASSLAYFYFWLCYLCYFVLHFSLCYCIEHVERAIFKPNCWFCPVSIVINGDNHPARSGWSCKTTGIWVLVIPKCSVVSRNVMKVKSFFAWCCPLTLELPQIRNCVRIFCCAKMLMRLILVVQLPT